MKKFLLLVKSLLDGTALKQAIDHNYVNLGGQGRDKYGK
jgi:hypothetical protein